MRVYIHRTDFQLDTWVRARAPSVPELEAERVISALVTPRRGLGVSSPASRAQCFMGVALQI